MQFGGLFGSGLARSGKLGRPFLPLRRWFVRYSWAALADGVGIGRSGWDSCVWRAKNSMADTAIVRGTSMASVPWRIGTPGHGT